MSFSVYKVRCSSTLCGHIQKAVTKFSMNWCEQCQKYGMMYVSRILLCKSFEYFAVMEKNQSHAKEYLQNTDLTEPTKRILVLDQMGLFHHDVLTIDLVSEK